MIVIIEIRKNIFLNYIFDFYIVIFCCHRHHYRFILSFEKLDNKCLFVYPSSSLKLVVRL